jgi:hypothetical protein
MNICQKKSLKVRVIQYKLNLIHTCSYLIHKIIYEISNTKKKTLNITTQDDQLSYFNVNTTIVQKMAWSSSFMVRRSMVRSWHGDWL